jgi:uncharacterized spore protein YtfJ
MNTNTPAGVACDPRSVLMMGDEPEDDSAELIRLRGEAKVLRALLGECADVLETICTDDQDEAEELTALLAAIAGATQGAAA